MKLLLFDIDGTMLRTHGIGRRSVERALSEICDRPVDSSAIQFSGKTDPQIIREVLVANGFNGAFLNGLVDESCRRYAELMEHAIRPHGVEVLPGVRNLIHNLSARDDVQLALLTGNLEPMAYLKLAAVDLDQYFPFGAFGSDNPDRYKLPNIAVSRAEAYTGQRFEGSDVVIIGDTEHDIGCGREIGAFSVAVCTGRFDRACLNAFGADILFDHLEDYKSFVDSVLM